jgi:hypothetical protein
MLRRLVQTVLILLAALSSLAAVEVPVSDLTFETAPTSKRLPALAAGHDGYLAVWLDERSGSRNLLATRIAATGEPLDPLGIPLGRAEFRQPQVLWNGESYLVFWNATYADGSGLMVTRVTREGVAEAPRVLRQQGRLDLRARAVATNGTHIVLAYTKGANAMHVAVMTRDAVLIEERIVDARNSFSPTVLVNGRNFLIAWNVNGAGGYDFVAQRLDFRGAAIDASPRRIGDGFGADILRNGSDYVAFGPTSLVHEPAYVSWQVSGDLGAIGDSAPLPLRHDDREPSLLDGAPAMLVVFETSATENPFVAAVTFNAKGHEAGPRKRILESGPSHFAVSRGDDALALIEVKPHQGFSTDALIGSIFDDDTLAQKAPERSLALSAREQSQTAIAGGGGRYLAVWEGSEGVTAGRFLPNGTRLDGNGFALDPQASSPAVVFDGQRFVVSYVRQRGNATETIIRFVSPRDGLLPETVLIDRPDRGWMPPSLAVGDGVVLVTWVSYEGVHAAALRGTQLIAPPRQIAESTGTAPAAEWNGRHFLVVWDEEETDWDIQVAVRLQSMRLESDLTPVDAQPRMLLAHTTGHKNAVLSPWKGGWLIAFQNSYLNGHDIRIHEINESGAMEATPFATVDGHSPKLVSTGSRAWLAWTTSSWNELRAAPVRPDGTLGTEGALSITAPALGLNFGYSSAITALGADIAVSYARVALEAGTVRRVFVSMVDNPTQTRRRAVR